MEGNMNCSICENPITKDPISGWDGGHNSEPVAPGRCCDDCNSRVVIPTRLAAIFSVKEKEATL
tara:strand:- start:288 stop:479 length:192 start_codon:yes stop_codon:yes gene_type:complete